MKKPSYLPIFGILAVTAFLHLAALKFYLYFDLWWLDIILHFLGGVWVAATVFWAYYFSGWYKNPVASARRFFIVTLSGAVIVGIAWELFEYHAGLTFVLPGIDYRIDTLCDLGMDVVGGLSAYLYYRLTRSGVFH